MVKMKKSIAIASPEVPFEDYSISLSASGVLDDGNPDIAISLQLTPYRVIDGYKEILPQHAVTYSSGFTLSEKANKAWNDLADDIEKAIAKFATAKGV